MTAGLLADTNANLEANKTCLGSYADLLRPLDSQAREKLLRSTDRSYRDHPTAQNGLRLGVMLLRTGNVTSARAQFALLDSDELCPAERELLALYRARAENEQLRARVEQAEAKLEALTTIERRIEDDPSAAMPETRDD